MASDTALSDLNSVRIGVIGLGYVGLPLAVVLARKFLVVGFDINKNRIAELEAGVDRTREVERSTLAACPALFSDNLKDLEKCNFYIVAVPTPIDHAKRPDLGPLLSACRTVGKVLSKGDFVVFESTVYPGATEEECVPVLEEISGLKFNRDFYAGYSPERANPGDKEHTVDKIIKVTSGSTPEAAELIDQVYQWS